MLSKLGETEWDRGVKGKILLSLQLYDSWRIISEISNCRWQICCSSIDVGTCVVLWEGRPVQTTWKRNTATNIGLERTGICLTSLLIHVSSSTWFEMGVGGSWETLVSHWDSVVFNGAPSGYVKSIDSWNRASRLDNWIKSHPQKSCWVSFVSQEQCFL